MTRQYIFKLALVITGVLFAFDVYANPYAEDSAMGQVWGFANRQTPRGFMHVSEAIATLDGHSKGISDKPATPEQRKDIIAAMARAVLIAPQEVRVEVSQLKGKLASTTGTTAHRHYQALVGIYESLLDYDGKTPLTGELAAVREHLVPVSPVQIKGGRHVEPRFMAAFAEAQDMYNRGYYVAHSGKVVSVDTVQKAEAVIVDPTPKFYPLAPGGTQIFYDTHSHEEIFLNSIAKLTTGLSSQVRTISPVEITALAMKIAIVDYANATNIGGDPRRMGTQEEELVRELPGLYESLCATGYYDGYEGRRAFLTPIIDRENLRLAQEKWNRAITSTVDAYYIPRVPFVRQRTTVEGMGQQDGRRPVYEVFDEPLLVNVIASAAPDFRAISKGTPGWVSSERYEEQTKKKIRAQIQAALDHGHTILLTGLFGCGAFENKIEDIARFYAEVLSEAPYRNRLEAVYFSAYHSVENARKFEANFKTAYQG